MEKIIKKKDRRVEKTKKNICEALTTLIVEKEISKITIKEVSERANINRKTFYMHYKCIEDVLESIENEIVDKFLKVLEEYNFFDAEFDVYSFFLSLNNVLNENIELYKRLVNARSSDFFMTKIKEILKDIIKKRYEKEINMKEEIFNLYAEYSATGVIALYVEWLKNDSKLSIEEVAKVVGNITYNGIKTVFVK